MEKGDFIYIQEIYIPEWETVHLSNSVQSWVWKPTGVFEEHFVLDGRDYASKEEALGWISSQSGLSPEEAEEYLALLPRENWDPRKLNLEEGLKWENQRIAKGRRK